MEIKVKTIASTKEQENRSNFYNLYSSNPIPQTEQLANIGLFKKRQELSKQLFLDSIYQKIVNVHGVIMEFGVRWGQNLVTLTNLRGIYEPYNYSRKIIGFDTFDGFASIDSKDGNHEIIQKGAFGVSQNYDQYLQKILEYHESESPLNHIKKNFLVKGDATITVDKYLKDHPETIIALAYFDFDIYAPTKTCLETIKPYLTKGSVIAFDELNDPQFPGETIALRESLGINNIRIERNRFSAIQSYCIIE
jgi:hypothetical protein